MIVAAVLAGPAAAQPTPAGVDIINRAVVDYHDGPTPLSTVSNAIATRVLPVYAIALTPAGTLSAPAWSLSGAPGDTVYCRFDVENLGNSRDSLAVTSRGVGSPTTTITAVVLFHDANGNGVFDAGEDDPSFLSFAVGETIDLDVGVVIAAGAAAGEAYVEVEVASLGDPAAVDRSVIRVSSTGPVAEVLFLGPAGNPRATPGGDGSEDDLTTATLGYDDKTVEFENDVLNDSPVPHVVELVLPDVAAVAPDMRLSVADSSGSLLRRSPTSRGRFVLGRVGAGSSRRFKVTVTSATGVPLFKLSPSQLSLDITARSLTDTLQENSTTDRLIPPQAISPGAAIALRQTFYETSAAAGDVVTLVVTVENITDSLRVDGVGVEEFVQPQLDFLQSASFVSTGRRLSWQVGTMRGGESRTAVVKFVANTRVRTGLAKAVGNAAGRAASGDGVSAGPVVSSVKIDNDVFGVEGIILGDVFVDANENGIREKTERGVANVAVYLESGEYAVTDSSGAFSVPRVFAGYRMVRLDESGVPSGLSVGEPSAGAFGGRPNERLVHLLPGGHARVSFPLVEIPLDRSETATVVQSISCQEKVSVQRRARVYRAASVPSSYFALGKARLAYGADRTLKPVVAFLEAHDGWGVLVDGHTDSLPIHTEQFPSNYELSLARAEAVRDRFVSLGVGGNRIVTRGYGDTRPVSSNATVEGRRDNRRVDLSLIPPGVDAAAAGVAGGGGATLDEAVALPDELQVTILWEFFTTRSRAVGASLRVDVPSPFDSSDVSVTIGGRPVGSDGGLFDLSDFSRSAPVRCRVSFGASVNDTASIDRVTAALTTPTDSVRIHPFQGGPSVEAATQREVVGWTEPAEQSSPPSVPDVGGVTLAADTARGDVDSNKRVALLTPTRGEVFGRSDRLSVLASVPLGTRTALFVNGEPVPESRIGQRSIDVRAGEEQITWYAVKIEPGWNTLAVESRLIDGGVETDTVRVALASRTAAVAAVRERVLVPADGRTRESIAFDVTDRLGLPVADGIVASVVEGEELVEAVDARPLDRGLQVLVEDGRVVLETRASGASGRATVAIECDGFRGETDVSFVSPRRPMFATGLVDVKLGSFETTGQGSGAGVEDYHDGVNVDGESRMFMQGTMPHGVSLTARLDSKKRFDDPLLKDINADRQYPVFGDASSLHHAAPSQGGNYVSVDRGESYVRYGDFRTPLDDGEFLSYRRAATGLTSALVRGNSSFKSFLTKTDFSTHQDEIPADGTSGFYYLSRAPVVEQSEQVVLETRDRYRRETVLDVRPMVRNRDYTISYFDGSLLFKEPVSAFDRDFNPVVIVATYEVKTNDDAQFLYGARGNLIERNTYHVGATAVARSGDGQDYALFGAEGGLSVGSVAVTGEFARSDDDAAGSGNAFKVEASHSNGATKHTAYLRRVDGDFTNPSFRGASHELSSLKSGFQSGLDLGGDISLDVDGYVHRFDRTGERKRNLRALAIFRHPLFRFQAGARVARHKEPTRDANAALAIAGVEVGVDDATRISTVLEKNLTSESVEDYPDRLKTLASLPLRDGLKLVGSHEYLTAEGRAGSHQVSAGIESRIRASTTAYTKYSMSRTAGDKRMGAVTGVKQHVQLRRGLVGSFGVEGFRSFSDRPDDEYVSVKSGLNARKSGVYLVESQYEYRWQARRTRHLVRLNAARQLRSGFAALLENVLSVLPDDSSDDEFGVHSKVALAHRPSSGAVQSLWMMRNDYERYTPVNPQSITWRLVVSGDVNVKPQRAVELRLKYAFKHVEDYSYGVSQSTDADLLLGQSVYRFARNWDADLWGRLVGQRHGGSVEGGAGVEVGRLWFNTLRVAAGYSINGFEDPDFAGTDAWSRGFGVRVQLLLSDRLLDELGMVD